MLLLGLWSLCWQDEDDDDDYEEEQEEEEDDEKKCVQPSSLQLTEAPAVLLSVCLSVRVSLCMFQSSSRMSLQSRPTSPMETVLPVSTEIKTLMVHSDAAQKLREKVYIIHYPAVLGTSSHGY